MQEMQEERGSEELHVMGDLVRIQVAIRCELSFLLQKWEMKIVKLFLHVLHAFNIFN